MPPASGWSERLIHCRTVLELSRKESAKRVGVDQSTLARWERGEREPTGSFLTQVVQFLNEAEPAWSAPARIAQHN